MGDAITAITLAWSLFDGSDLVLSFLGRFLEQKAREKSGWKLNNGPPFEKERQLVLGGAGGNCFIILETSTRTHKNQPSPDCHPRSVGSS